MTDTTANTTEIDPIKLKKLKEEINSELSKAVANSQISQILRNYGISDPDFLRVRFSLKSDKLQGSDSERKLIPDAENTFNNGETIYRCLNSEGDQIVCPNPC